MEKYEIKFWRDWLKADCLKRLDMIEKLPLFKMCLVMKDEDMWRKSFATLINGYFEDLESAVCTKLSNEKEAKSHAIRK